MEKSTSQPVTLIEASPLKKILLLIASEILTVETQRSTATDDNLLFAIVERLQNSAPKVRAMEIIDEIEPHRRGPYAGAVGYIDFNGNMDTCIALVQPEDNELENDGERS